MMKKQAKAEAYKATDGHHGEYRPRNCSYCNRPGYSATICDENPHQMLFFFAAGGLTTLIIRAVYVVFTLVRTFKSESNPNGSTQNAQSYQKDSVVFDA